MTHWMIEVGLILIAVGFVNMVAIAVVLTWVNVRKLEEEWSECRHTVERFERGYGSRSR